MKGLLVVTLLCLMPHSSVAVQVVAGSPEDKALQKILAETNGDSKLQKLSEFEKQFPKSRVLPNIYLMFIDLYREKDDTDRVIEYAEKVLQLDETNVTAMMVLSRNYAIRRTNLDRAVELAQKAIDQLGKMRAMPAPTTQTEAQWKTYLDTTEASAKSILSYTVSVRGR